MRHLKISISGAVQGVGFRFYARKKAIEFNLNGYAENNRDGTVVIEIEGRDKDVEKFAVWCQEGPPSAKIEDVQIQEGTVQNFSGFDCL